MPDKRAFTKQESLNALMWDLKIKREYNWDLREVRLKAK